MTLKNNTDTHSEPCQRSKMEPYEKMVNGWKSLAISAKPLMLDVWHSSSYASAIN